ncbi:MAG: lipid A biosynthesis acyltransferase [Chitinophagaceae bacterium]|nr:lipid A biosynthesis acyltransferase [Chitinophagaceae bacterium]
MYYIVYGCLYVFSLLPLRVLYLFSDLAYSIVYYVSGYRKKIVLSNLQIAFPEKSDKERIKIAKQFYLNFTDTLIESVKMISMSEKELEKRAKGEFGYINELLDKGYSVNVMASHQFNWEFANLIYAKNLKAPFVGIYMQISNKILDKIFFTFRARYGTVLISAQDFKDKMHSVFSGKHALALAADQNPGNRSAAYWMKFFGRPVPFISGPAKGAVKNNTAVVFVAFHKVKRGYYEFKVTPISQNSADYTPEQLTLLYKNVVEATIRKDPANYLWSHRRWKWEWKEEHGAIVK